MKRTDVHDLELRHRSLEHAIHELERRRNHMTPEDHSRATELKKQRLAMKDQLYSMRRS